MTQLTLCEIVAGLLADTSPPLTLWIREGYDAIQRGINALGENRHTIYLQSYLDFTPGKDPRELAIVYGINHAAFGKVIYSNVGAYSRVTMAGVGAVASEDLEGTAEAFLPGNPLAKYFSVHRVARTSLGDPNTLVIKLGATAETIGGKDNMVIGFAPWWRRRPRSVRTTPRCCTRRLVEARHGTSGSEGSSHAVRVQRSRPSPS